MNENSRQVVKKKPVIALFVFYIIVFLCMDLIAGYIFLDHPERGLIRTADPYFHHGLLPSHQEKDNWAGEYITTTNGLGFKDSSTSTVSLVSDKHRILFMGDSFLEGLGYPFQETLVGYVREEFDGYDVLNAGVTSYSPKIYYYKVKRLLESGFKTDEIVTFIDISDIQDEITYKGWQPTTPNSFGFILTKLSARMDFFLQYHSLFYLHVIRPTTHGYTTQRIKNLLNGKPLREIKEDVYFKDRGRWAFDKTVYDDWGKKGVSSALYYMKMLAKLCEENNIKLSVAIYPWPDNILEDDLRSRQIRIWDKFSQDNKTGFFNFFPVFMSTSTLKEKIVETYFINGDKHWNKAGNRLMADEWLRQYRLTNNLKTL
jgi:hypothetical protein